MQPVLRNTEIANQANLDVVINSNDPNYNDDTDYSDGGGASALGNPCALHPTADDIEKECPDRALAKEIVDIFTTDDR